ncbi:MAG: hypothetical protein PHY47_09965 [Lachnospiraceae bacterium]|nr:hypothetical protein [Lachnospiraceae bacterium]
MKKIVGFIFSMMLVCSLFQVKASAANVMVTFITPNGVVAVVGEQGSDFTYKGPTDVNVSGYAFCGWDRSLTNVQSNIQTNGVYVAKTKGSTEVCTTYKTLPAGVLSYSNAWAGTLNISKEVQAVKPTPVATPCTLTAAQTVAMNPVGVPGVTCVVKWYNGSTSELWKTDVVAYGATLPQPANPCMAGLEFTGWDGSWSNITSDRNIIACYYKNYTVKYVCGICGEVQDIQYVRRGDSCKNCTAHSHSGKEFKYWADPEIQADGTTAIVRSVYE